jgi:hypothetical protein
MHVNVDEFDRDGLGWRRLVQVGEIAGQHQLTPVTVSGYDSKSADSDYFDSLRQ